jgi:hypothetical protein
MKVFKITLKPYKGTEQKDKPNVVTEWLRCESREEAEKRAKRSSDNFSMYIESVEELSNTYTF